MSDSPRTFSEVYALDPTAGDTLTGQEKLGIDNVDSTPRGKAITLDQLGVQVGGVQTITVDATIVIDDTDPQNLIMSAAGVQSVVAGTNVTVDATDAQNPIVSASGGGGGSSKVTPQIFTEVAAVGDGGGLGGIIATLGVAQGSSASNSGQVDIATSFDSITVVNNGSVFLSLTSSVAAGDTDEGIFRSIGYDPGTWARIGEPGATIPNTQGVSAPALTYNTSSKLFMVSDINGTGSFWDSLDGLTWSKKGDMGLPSFICYAIVALTDKLLYAFGNSSVPVVKSIDGGITWNSAGATAPGSWTGLVDKGSVTNYNGDIYLCGLGNDIYKFDVSTESLSVAFSFFSGTDSGASISINDKGTTLVATSASGEVVTSGDGGVFWQEDNPTGDKFLVFFADGVFLRLNISTASTDIAFDGKDWNSGTTLTLSSVSMLVGV